MHHGNAFSLHIFFPSGDPDGLRVVKKDNWSGRAIAFRRDRMDEAAGWKGLEHTGVYILRSEEDQKARTYVGEANDVAKRLKRHRDDGDKDFWTDAVAFVRTGDSLDKAEVGYLEARLIQLAEPAESAGWCTLTNDQRPDPEGRLEDDREAAAEGYLEEMLECLRALGIPEFHPLEEMWPAAGTGDRTLHVKRKGVVAHGHYLPDCPDSRKFEVLGGATAAKEEVESLGDIPYRRARQLRQQMIDEKLLVEEGNVYVLQSDYTFNSPSQAEAVLAGRPGSGISVWRSSSEDATGDDEATEPEDEAD